MNRVALRAGVPPFYVMDVWLAAAERQRTHGDLVNLSAGQPSAGAPAAVRAAAAEALEHNPLGYTVALGIPELREAIAGAYQTRHGIVVDADDVVVTTGSSGGFLLAFLACFDVGDRVVVTSPGYPCYRNILSALGCEVVDLPCGPETRFQPTAQMLAALDPPVRGVVVASPANPTGTVIPPAELAAIATWCDDTGVQLISDEVYHGLVYPGAPATSCAWETSRNSIVMNSFSKYFAMTGWRLGWMLVPPELRRAADCLTGNFTICPPVHQQRRPLSVHQPVLPQLRYKAGILACLQTGATLIPQLTFDSEQALEAVQAAYTVLPGRRRSTRRSSTTPSAATTTCPRCGSPSPGRPSCRWC